MLKYNFNLNIPKQHTTITAKQYVDSCYSYEILLQDSGLLPKPNDEWNTFEPKENDLALVQNQEYIFRGGK